MKQFAKFNITGRVGKVHILDKVSFVEICANYRRKVGEEWQDDPHWNRVTLFGKLHERAANLKKGDLINLDGRIKQGSHQKDGVTQYTVDLIAYTMATDIAEETPAEDGESESN